MPKLEQLLLGAVSLIFLPMIIYSGYMAYLAFGEGERLLQAPTLTPGQAVSGNFYQLTGQLNGALLSPVAYPEIKDALQIRAQRQTRSDTLTDAWVDDESTPAQTLRAEHVLIGSTPLELSDTARIVAPIAEAFHMEAPTTRWHLYYRPVTGLTFTLFGFYEHGAMSEGTYDRILLVTNDQVPATLLAAAAAGRTKGVILSVIAVVLAGLGALSLRAALRGSTGRRTFGQT